MLSVRLTLLMGQCCITLILSPKFPQNCQHIILLYYFFNKNTSRIFKYGSHLETLLQWLDFGKKKEGDAVPVALILGDPATE